MEKSPASWRVHGILVGGSLLRWQMLLGDGLLWLLDFCKQVVQLLSRYLEGHLFLIDLGGNSL